MKSSYYKNQEKQECSQEVYDLLVAFNNLPSLAEQEEVLDVIYDALYDRSYRETLQQRITDAQSRHIEGLEEDIRVLKSTISDQNKKIMNLIEAQGEKKKTLRTRINGLLSIIGKLKQYLGEEWQDVFQEDAEEIDAFLKAARKNPVPDANEIG